MGEAALVNENPVIDIRGLRKSYKKKLAVDGVALTVKQGEIYGLIGPDGAGKSSLMKAIAGVLSFEQGSLTVFEVNIDSEAAAEKVKGRLGFMPQGLGLNLYGDLSVEENIDFFAQLRQVSLQQLSERKEKLLTMTRLDKFRDRPMKNLSGGMKQKLGLVCTLIHNPELVILDEPTTGVDPVSRRDFWAILAELLREQGTTALVSTAYMDEAARFHRLSLMYNGQVLADGEPDAICQQAQGCMVELTSESQTEALGKLKSHYPQLEAIGTKIRVFVDNLALDEATSTVSGHLDGLQIKSIKAFDAELEDAFIALLRQGPLAPKTGKDESIPRFDKTLPDDKAIAIEARQLCKDFDQFRSVDKISFKVRQGEIFGLLGANGAGKTTAIKMLTGILPPSDGEGQVAGADMRNAAQAIKERIGYMSQAFSLYLDLTVIENIHLYASIYGVSRSILKQRLDWVIQIAGLEEVTAQLAGSLPMGVRQRLALGCALVHQPGVLFLDEPTSGVDPIGRRHFWEILMHLASVEQVAILVTTHYMSEAEHCDHLALMYAGRVIADDTPGNMIQALQDEAGQLLNITTDQPLQALALLEKSDFKGVALFGRHIHLLAQDRDTAEKKIRELLDKESIKLLNLSADAPSLEDVFVYRVLALENQEPE
ncbi:MAG: ATP-binding cassette domain-containing protein [Methylicorpusculum sp.]|uniref:ATP-binding cassette domain-containing protein n=1 Tax=Methylicorpusculum sp. TaxID=2713644 RepID=UPI0027211DDA|nr:ATP-binding cassette domain-containing protein [Methylicorpusculum sp.]MDO8939056.1 ATP-binding cassette domain-containing protein [Methylicorpusculum sp.]MDP2202927.1 ATP-binding cassette domain-containing protein [Methylicorpusculum sp.]